MAIATHSQNADMSDEDDGESDTRNESLNLDDTLPYEVETPATQSPIGLDFDSFRNQLREQFTSLFSENNAPNSESNGDSALSDEEEEEEDEDEEVDATPPLTPLLTEANTAPALLTATAISRPEKEVIREGDIVGERITVNTVETVRVHRDGSMHVAPHGTTDWLYVVSPVVQYQQEQDTLRMHDLNVMMGTSGLLQYHTGVSRLHIIKTLAISSIASSMCSNSQWSQELDCGVDRVMSILRARLTRVISTTMGPASHKIIKAYKALINGDQSYSDTNRLLKILYGSVASGIWAFADAAAASSFLKVQRFKLVCRIAQLQYVKLDNITTWLQGSTSVDMEPKVAIQELEYTHKLEEFTKSCVDKMAEFMGSAFFDAEELLFEVDSLKSAMQLAADIQTSFSQSPSYIRACKLFGYAELDFVYTTVTFQKIEEAARDAQVLSADGVLSPIQMLWKCNEDNPAAIQKCYHPFEYFASATISRMEGDDSNYRCSCGVEAGDREPAKYIENIKMLGEYDERRSAEVMELYGEIFKLRSWLSDKKCQVMAFFRRITETALRDLMELIIDVDAVTRRTNTGATLDLAGLRKIANVSYFTMLGHKSLKELVDADVIRGVIPERWWSEGKYGYLNIKETKTVFPTANPTRPYFNFCKVSYLYATKILLLTDALGSHVELLKSKLTLPPSPTKPLPVEEKKKNKKRKREQ
jgi:hypothetical protein